MSLRLTIRFGRFACCGCLERLIEDLLFPDGQPVEPHATAK